MSLPPVLISSDNALSGANVRIDVSARQIRISWPVSTNKPRIEYNFQSLAACSNTLFRGIRLEFDMGEPVHFYPVDSRFNINGQELTPFEWLGEIILENKREHASPGGITDPQWVIQETIRSDSRDPGHRDPGNVYQTDELVYGDLVPISSLKEPGAPSTRIFIVLCVLLGFLLLRRYYLLAGVDIVCLALCFGRRMMVRQAFAYLDEPNKLIRFNFPRSGSVMKSFPLSELLAIKTFYWGGLFFLKFQGDRRWYMFAPDYSDPSVNRHSLKARLLKSSLDTVEASTSA